VNGTPIALLFAPVMYGSSGQHRASLINTRYPAEQPHQSDRLGAALRKREEPAGKPEIEAGEIVAALQLTGRPVTSETFDAAFGRHSLKSGVSYIRPFFSLAPIGPSRRCPEFVELITKGGSPQNAYLPLGSLPCTIGVAYQAADAGHPGLGRACSPQSQKNIVRQSDCDQAVRDEGLYRKGHSQRKAEAVSGKVRLSD
jgi:hypothetical protein